MLGYLDYQAPTPRQVERPLAASLTPQAIRSEMGELLNVSPIASLLKRNDSHDVLPGYLLVPTPLGLPGILECLTEAGRPKVNFDTSPLG